MWGRLDQTFNLTMSSLADPTFMRTMTSGRGFQVFWGVLSSLTAQDWDHYSMTGSLPQTYDPWDDALWYR